MTPAKLSHLVSARVTTLHAVTVPAVVLRPVARLNHELVHAAESERGRDGGGEVLLAVSPSLAVKHPRLVGAWSCILFSPAFSVAQ